MNLSFHLSGILFRMKMWIGIHAKKLGLIYDFGCFLLYFPHLHNMVDNKDWNFLIILIDQCWINIISFFGNFWLLLSLGVIRLRCDSSDSTVTRWSLCGSRWRWGWAVIVSPRANLCFSVEYLILNFIPQKMRSPESMHFHKSTLPRGHYQQQTWLSEALTWQSRKQGYSHFIVPRSLMFQATAYQPTILFEMS